jgi:FAD/FMN-containing dehydrogenase
MSVLLLAHTGDTAAAAIDAVRAALPKPLIDWVGPISYPALQGMFDALNPPGMQWYWKGDFVRELTDAAIEQHLRHAAKTPSELSLMHLYPIDKAVHAVGSDETPWGARDATWSMVIAAIDPDPAKAGALTAWAKAYWEGVHPHNLGGGYVNFMSDDEGDARVRASYGANFDRLVAVKRKYDPENLFRVNQNISPST